jgi:hypothetical protein
MKPQIISRFCGCLFSILLVSCTFAQKSGDKNLATVLFPQDAVSTGNNSDVLSIVNITVSKKVEDAFVKSFENVTNLNWSKVDNKFLATFTVAGKERRALFTKKGNLVYSIVYGTEADLPVETRKLIKSTYIDHTIAMAIEVREDNRTIWVIRLEDATNLIFVWVENGEMEETKHYQKSK